MGSLVSDELRRLGAGPTRGRCKLLQHMSSNFMPPETHTHNYTTNVEHNSLESLLVVQPIFL